MKNFRFRLQRFAAVTTKYGTGGDDMIFTGGGNYAVSALGGNDWIQNGEDYVTIDGGSGADIVYNSGSNVTVYGGDGNDTLVNEVYSYTDETTLNGGDGNDTIANNGGSYAVILGGDGSDSIYSSGSNVTISGDAGDDRISLAGSRQLIQYYAGQGDDTVLGFSANDTLQIFGGSYSTQTSGSDLVVSVGSGSVLLKNAANVAVNIAGTPEGGSSSGVTISNSTANTVINGTAYNDSIYNSASYVTISVGAGADTVYNYGSDYSRIYLGDGADSLYGYYNDSVTVDAGAGNDTITGSYYSSRISAGAGADYLSIGGGDNTLDGGDGSDTIYANTYGNSINGGAGNDRISLYSGIWSNSYNTVKGGTGNDTIYGNSISAEGNIYQYASGDGYDTIYGFTTADILHITSGSYTTTKSGNDFIVSVGSGSVVLKNIFDNYHKVHVKNSSGTVAVYNDVKARYGTSGADTLINPENNASVAVYGQGGNDRLINYTNNVTLSGGDGADYIMNYTVWYVSIDGGAGNDSIDNWGSYSTINGGAGNDDIFNDDNYALIDGGEGNDSINSAGNYTTIYGGADADIISLLSSSGYGGKNTILGGTGNDTVYLNSATTLGNVYVYENGDGNDKIYGVTNYDTISVGGASYSTATTSGGDVIVSVGSGAMTLVGASGKSFKLIGDTVPTPVEIFTTGDDSYTNTVSATVLSALAGNDTVKNTGANVSISGGSGSDVISLGGNSAGVTVNGGTGNDIIYGEYDWDLYDSQTKVDSNAGHVFQYAAGDGYDTILNSNVNDTLQITGASYGTIISGVDNIIVTVSGSGYVYLPENLLENIEGNFTGNPQLHYNSNKTAVTLDSDFCGNLARYYYESTVSLVDAAQITTTRNFYMLGRYYTTMIRGRQQDNFVMLGSSQNDYLMGYSNGGTISGNAGNDMLYNSGDNAFIYGGDGNDDITNNGANALADAGTGNDTIYVSGTASTIIGGTGSDTIHNNNGGNLYLYSAGDGSDLFTSFYSNDTLQISGGTFSTQVSGSDLLVSVGTGIITILDAATDEVNIQGAKNTIVGTSGNDTIRNSTDSATIDALEGDDEIINLGSYVSINAGAGNDYVYSDANRPYVTIRGGAGNDELVNWGNFGIIDGGTGADNIYNRGSNVTINGGADNDTIENLAGDSVTIDAGAGNDSIEIHGEKVSVNGGAGNDTLFFSWSSKEYPTLTGGAGNDVFRFTPGSVTIRFTVTDISEGDTILNNSSASPEDIAYATLTGGSLRLYDNSANTFDITLRGVSSIDEIYDVKYRTSKGTYTFGEIFLDLEINGTAGADSLNNTLNGATINALAGNDTIKNAGSSVLISGGTGNDVISLGSGAEYVTISGNSGADTIYTNGSGNVIEYEEGDGKDTIYNFGGADSIQIAGTVSKVSMNSAGNTLITVGSASNVLTLKNVAQNNISVSGGVITYVENPEPEYPMSLTTGADTATISDDNATVYALAGNDTLKISGKSGWFDAGAGADKISLSSGATGNRIFGGADNDSVYNAAASATISGDAGNDTINNTASKVSISGGAGTDRISLNSSASGVTITGGAGNDTIYSNNKGNLILYSAGDGNDCISGSGANDTLKITGGTYSLSGSVVSVYSGETFSGKITFKGSAPQIVGTLKPEPEPDYPKSLTASANSVTISDDEATVYALAGNDTLKITGNDGYFDGGAGADKLSLDSYAAGNTLHGGAGADTIWTNGAGNLIRYGTTDGKDVIVGFGGDDSIQLGGTVKNSRQSGANVLVTVSGTSNVITIKDSQLENLSFADGVISVRSPITLTAGVDKYTNADDYASIEASLGNDILTNTGNLVSISGGNGNDKITNTGNGVTLTGGAGNDTIITNGDTALLEGGAGSDKISLGSDAGNVTISGGDGADTIYTNGAGNLIQYDAGKDVIVGFGGDDSIQISGTISRSVQSGANVLVNVGSASNVITIRDVQLGSLGFDEGILSVSDTNKYLTEKADATLIADENIFVDALAGNDKITLTGSEVTADGGAGNDTIISSGNDVSIFGGAGNDRISLSGTAANVTVSGGGGNDSVLTNGRGNIIQFSGGKDTVYGFGSDDSIQISGTVKNSSQKGANVLVTVDSASNVLTLREVQLGELSFENNIISVADTKKYLTEKADTTLISASNIFVDALAGNDKITLTGSEVTLSGGKGNDTLQLVDDDSVKDNVINGGAGSDLIYANGYRNTIQYGAGDGKDTIRNFGKDDIIQITGGSVSSSVTSGLNQIFYIGTGTANQIVIRDSEFEEFQITKGADGETIAHKNSPAIFSCTYGDDEVTIGSSEKGILIKALDGADYIDNSGTNITISGGVGNDSIVSSGKSAVIRGGAGNDYITLNGSTHNNIIQYAAGDGKDFVTGFGGDDRIEITGGTVSKTSQSGANVLATVGSSANVITFKNTSLADLIFDDNFIYGSGRNSNGARLDDICAESFAVTQLETSSFENLAQTELLSLASSAK